ncbi:MAG: hypothetical protein KatS3mg121_0719 [Gammaproteobacteria bacterium]|nr:MAG: hypothetical protein KatS3mg121_0719 [Gammaproteobacteria bacterium]
MKRAMCMVFTGLALAAGAPAMAAGVAAQIQIGTLGPGAELAFALPGPFAARLGLNRFTYSGFDLDDAEGLDYDAELELRNEHLFLDWQVFGHFRLSGGYLRNGMRLSASAQVRSDGEARVGARAALAGTRVEATVDFDESAGYVGLGFGNTFGGGRFVYAVDLGVVQQGSPRVALDVTLPPQLDGCVPSDEGCIGPEDIERERQDVEAEIRDLDVWPVVSVGFGLRF